MGSVATVVVQNGTLNLADFVAAGKAYGKIRSMTDARGAKMKSAGPSTPVLITGISDVPATGDILKTYETLDEAKHYAETILKSDRAKKMASTKKLSVTGKDLNLIIKVDVLGSLEAINDALNKLKNTEVKLNILEEGAGEINENDVLHAQASNAIIIGFHVRPDNNARAAAERDGVEIKLYRIIYEAVAEVRAALEGLLRPDEKEVVLGEAEVRELFKVPRIGVIAGCTVRSGVINRAGKVRVVRDGVEVYGGTIGSLRRFKDDVKEVREGFECGIGIENFNDLKVGDVIECYRTDQIARTL